MRSAICECEIPHFLIADWNQWKRQYPVVVVICCCLFLVSVHLYIYSSAFSSTLATRQEQLTVSAARESAGETQLQLETELLQLLTADEGSWCERRLLVGGRCYCQLDSEAAHAWMDGSKLVCLDLLDKRPPETASQSAELQSSPECRVLSFGIDNDFSFDLQMQDLGCVVHSFDPTMQQADFRRSAGVFFHNKGLAAYTRDESSRHNTVSGENSDASANRSWPRMVTLDAAAALAGWHSGIIDYVKLDVESSEWPVLWHQTQADRPLSAGSTQPNTTLTRVRQLQIEIHLMQWKPALEAEYSKFYEESSVGLFVTVLRRLKLLGFRLVSSRPYYHCKPLFGGGCLGYLYDTHWINSNLL